MKGVEASLLVCESVSTEAPCLSPTRTTPSATSISPSTVRMPVASPSRYERSFARTKTRKYLWWKKMRPL